jgi:NAD(P)-dependent dehydrogenase (short-subunit alcohol dehydrogenase family)
MFSSKKNILVLGGNSEITLNIVDCLSLSPSDVTFVCSKEMKNISSLKEQFYVDFYDFTLFSVFVNEHLKHPFDGIVYAGGKGGVRPLKLNSPEFVHSMFHENVFTFFELVRLLLKKRLINKGASIVALSSVSSIKGLKSKTVYSASKAALDAAVRGMAAEMADKKIRVNSIQKGWVSSDMNLDFVQSNMALAEDNDFNNQLLGEIVPEELARLVQFLLSDAVRTLTGTNLLLDGGYTL